MEKGNAKERAGEGKEIKMRVKDMSEYPSIWTIFEARIRVLSKECACKYIICVDGAERDSC